jgi:hypothetical protein
MDYKLELTTEGSAVKQVQDSQIAEHVGKLEKKKGGHVQVADEGSKLRKKKGGHVQVANDGSKLKKKTTKRR